MGGDPCTISHFGADTRHTTQYSFLPNSYKAPHRFGMLGHTSLCQHKYEVNKLPPACSSVPQIDWFPLELLTAWKWQKSERVIRMKPWVTIDTIHIPRNNNSKAVPAVSTSIPEMLKRLLPQLQHAKKVSKIYCHGLGCMHRNWHHLCITPLEDWHSGEHSVQGRN